MLTALILFSITGTAQRAPKWVCNNGYWVVQSNLKQPQSNMVYFYNNHHELLYKEQVEGVVIRLQKRRVKMQLKKVLDQSLLAYEAQHKYLGNEKLVAALISKR